MPLNYSKWDALELSDDSDIECHPNVDKKSFIRLKQRQIHQQREERKIKIDQLKHEATLNAALLPHIRGLLDGAEKDGVAHLRQAASKLSAAGQAVQPASDREPTIEQMVFNLLSQVLNKIADQSDKDAAAVKEMTFHLTRLTEREEKRKVELEKEEAEAKKHITSDDVHDGFDVSYVDKKPSVAIDEPILAPSKPKRTKKVSKTSIEVLNPKATGSASAPAQDSNSSSDDDDEEELPKLSPSAQRFATIKASDYSASLSAIQADPRLYLEEATTDALLVEAFESEMKGKKAHAKNCVHQGLLLQYCRKLGRDGVSLFFKRVGSGEPKAMQVFIDDVNTTYERIARRCATIAAERAEQPAGQEQIQLVPTNPSTSITFEVPSGPPPDNLELQSDDPAQVAQLNIEDVRAFLLERWNTFQAFPKRLQKALQTKELERVNEVLGSMDIKEAEQVIQDLDRVGILSFSEGGIIDRTGAEQEGQQEPATEQPSQVVIPDELQ